jgi:hypothetical protein
MIQQVSGRAEEFARSLPDLVDVRAGFAIGCLNSLDEPKGHGDTRFCGECAIRVRCWIPYARGIHDNV